MSDSQRFERLVKQFDNLQFRDTAIINRVDFDFLLNSHNKHLRLQLEHEALIREYQKVKRLQGIEHNLTNMTERKVKRISHKNGWNHG